MFKSPLAQFDVVSVITIFLRNYEVSITNLSITVFFVLLVGYFLFFVFFVGHFIPRAWQRILESVFIFIYRLVFQQLGSKGLMYFPFIFSLFSFILMLNLFSLLPYGFAVTSHFVWTIYFSLSICLGIFFIGLINYKIKFLKLFVPEVPLFLYLLMIPIELLSYVLRSFSLAIRLSANIIAGHILVHILADFVLVLCKMHKLIVLLPFALLMAIFVLELGVACLQAYIFVTLICMYLNDSIHFSHH
jgi:F-type H+-transporting ATPase subunit a